MNLHNSPQPLLTMAKKDLKAAKVLALSNEPDVEIVGFHLQQATEKALKAWLVSLNQLETLGKNTDDLWQLAELNSFAVQFRYGLFDDEPFDWQGAHRQVQSLIETVEKEAL